MSSKVLYLWSVVDQGFADTYDEAQAIFMRFMEKRDKELTQPKTAWITTFAEHLRSKTVGLNISRGLNRLLAFINIRCFLR